MLQPPALERIRCSSDNALTAGPSGRYGTGLPLPQSDRRVGQGVVLAGDRVVTMVDVGQQIHQAARSLHPSSGGHLSATDLDPVRLLSWSHQNVRCIDTQRGKLQNPKSQGFFFFLLCLKVLGFWELQGL